MDVNFIKIGFSLTASDADPTDHRREANRIAGQVLRALANTLMNGTTQQITIRIRASPTGRAITGASLTRIAQSMDPLPAPPDHPKRPTPHAPTGRGTRGKPSENHRNLE